MNEEELFCKLFPEYVVNGKPLSPYFDLFESGYEQAENRIAELKAFRQDCVKLTEDNVVMARQRAETSKQLTKAKELLKRWLRLYNTNTVKGIIADTEQFLNSEVEK